MAKGKRGKGGKGSKSQKIEKEYKILTMEEQQARDAKYAMRLVDLRTCLSFIDDAFIRVDELKDQEDKLEKWNIYLRCDGLPKPYIPPDVRLFFEKLKHFESLDIEKTIDWLLSVNERSILTQDIFSKDKTRRVLVKELRPNYGDEYKENVDLMLKVIKSIEYYADDEQKTLKAELSILEDILEQKKAAYREIDKFFDRYAYRILSSEDSYMESVNATTAEYAYGCENFEIHMWTLKNVPILFRFLEIPCIEASLHKMKVTIQLPIAILQENLTIRGIHFHFDPFSENAKSYKQEIKHYFEDLTAGMPDLYECLIHEHFLQGDLQNQVRSKLIERRVEYENKVIAQAEQLESLKKLNDDENKKKPMKIIKLPKEPPIVTIDMFPDIWDDFLQLENERFNNFIHLVYHPDALQLEEDEINLKRYAILGGIYQLHFVKKPTHYNFNDFNMTWHENNGELKIIKDVIADEVLPVVSGMSIVSGSFIRSSTMSERRSLKRQSTKPESQPYEILQYFDTPNFVVTLELPDYLCLWGEPVACHFENDLIGYLEESASSPDHVQPRTEELNKLLVKNGRESLSKVSVDLSYTPRQSTVNMSVRLRRSLSNVYHTSLAPPIPMSQHQQTLSAQVQDLIEVEDFLMDYPLSVVQVCNIRRHCMPRIISSFKFPVELQDEATEEQRGKPKGKGGILLRKRQSEMDQDEETIKEFQYDGQNNPERIFPLFAHPEKMRIDYYKPDKNIESAAHTGTRYPKSFAELVQTLDKIKIDYQNSYKHTLMVPNKKIDPNIFSMRKKQVKTTASIDSSNVALTVRLSSTSSVPAVKHASMKQKQSISRMSQMDMAKLKEQKERDKERDKMEREVQLLRKQMAEAQAKAEAEKQAREEEEEEEEEENEDVAEGVPEPEVEDKRKTFRYSHWTTKYIKNTEYEKQNRKIIIWTDRLGTIGLAFKLYEHFPFKDWTLEPDMENEGEVIFTLTTQYVKCVLNISAKGYRGYVTEPTKGFVRYRKIYLDIKEPITDFKELKKRFRERFLNIFSNHDARFYIENGYFSEKHLACELHTYACMALHCLFLKFVRSDWNRLAQRRDIVLGFAHHREPVENIMCVRITPENATFVDIKELCSNNLDEFLLDYSLTWRNVDNYSDFHQLIMSIYLAALDNRCKDSKLLVNVKNLLSEIRPLSYS
ncbi:uncharacterized protein LOC129244862 [Anastrepha obliqua]|uniref:uncharacterized protein LOC129244862 n=1 Tax=Anastrepha obliqua TaxID=95512 RepID=UPI0024090AAA|nr:uncharacterized protein LOC129244862 [Anastrepha obliqua]